MEHFGSMAVDVFRVVTLGIPAGLVFAFEPSLYVKKTEEGSFEKMDPRKAELLTLGLPLLGVLAAVLVLLHCGGFPPDE